MPNAPKWIFDVAERLLPKLPLMEVVQLELLSPSVRKILFNGDFRNLKYKVGSYVDFRVSDTEARRYTASYADSKNGVLELIVHLHGEGSGSHFMKNLKIGDKVDNNPPRTYRYYDESAEKFVIFGDETSLGLALSFLPVLKKNNQKFKFIFELDDENKAIPELLGLENCIVFPKNGSFRKEEWVSELPVITTLDWQDANFVLTGNVKSAQTFKKVIKDKTNGNVYLHGYWLEGKKGL